MTMTISRGLQTLLVMSAMFALTACNATDRSNGTGSLSLNIADKAADAADHVYVVFTGVTVKHENEEPQAFEFDEPRRIDLLALQGENFDSLFADEIVRAGRYEWAFLHVVARRGEMDSTIVINDALHSLYLPRDGEVGLKLSSFNVPVNQAASFTIDFDLHKSVINPSGFSDYILKPTLRLVDNSEIGHIRGTVNVADFECSEPGNAVYFYEGRDAEQYDLNSQRDESENPITTAPVKLNADTGDYEFSAGFLTKGDYTAAFTCDADLDDPEAADTLVFKEKQTATVEAGEYTDLEFPANDE